ncbi:MAG: peroxidase family protein [Planctomycetales bacterium]|nr:peroxidase family protein [Planctomycetales bacterium]
MRSRRNARGRQGCRDGERAIRQLQLEQLELRMLLAADVYRSISGDGNNPEHPDWGAADTQLVRILPAAYGDGVSSPAGGDRPSAREISNAVVAQPGAISNDRLLTDFVWAWGQFIDHDLDLTDPASPAEPLDIAVPAGDSFFDPSGSGDQVIPLNRSIYDPATGTDSANPRQQVNEITSFIDASNVYGSDEVRAAALRLHVGGLMRTGDGELLPQNTAGLPNAPNTDSSLFLAGDVRANENVMLTSLHTVFVREHNRLAAELAASDYAGKDLTEPDIDEELYQRARQLVGAEIQAITYHEFLPALLGYGNVPTYAQSGGYDASVNPGVANLFSAAAFRVGHTMLSPALHLQPDVGDAESLPLREAFFNPAFVLENGVDAILRGAALQTMQEIDPYLVDDVRNFLFGPPGAGGFDLASLNIQRGRDHGLPSYNEARVSLGIGAAASFEQVSLNPEIVARLQSVYDSVDEVDLWVGAIAEDHLPGSSVGSLISAVLADQFYRTRAGDRFYYEHALPAAWIEEINNTRLSDIIQRNTAVSGMQANVFLADTVFYYRPPHGSGITALDLTTEDGELRLYRGDQLLKSQPLESVSRVVIEGAPDDVPVDLRIDVAAWPGVPLDLGHLRQLSLDGLRPTDSIEVVGDTIYLNGLPVFAPSIESVVAEGREGVWQSLGGAGEAPLRSGPAGYGYLMHSLQAVGERFPTVALGAAHAIVVEFLDGQWHYDNGVSLTPFEPRPTDVLLAELDYQHQLVLPLRGAARLHGIEAGVIRSDLSFNYTGNGVAVTGNAFQRLTPPDVRELGQLNMGLAANDDAVGEAHVLYSVESIFSRFAHSSAMITSNSEHLLVVFHRDGQWYYDMNGMTRPFEPRPSDVILADIDYTNDTIVGLAGNISDRHGIVAGYVYGDMAFYANLYGGAFNAGEFKVTGSYFSTLAPPKQYVASPRLAGEIAVHDGATGAGFVLYSQESVRQRFGLSLASGMSDHFVAVVHEQGQWQYDDGAQLWPFTPVESDRIVADVDFSTGNVQRLTGVSERGSVPDGQRGVQSGVTRGDLQFTSEAGAYAVSGTWFEGVASSPGLTFSVGALHHGIAARDGATGHGFLMYSHERIPDRFQRIPSGVSEHLIVVTYRDGGWKYDNNGGLGDFVPQPSDVLLAEIDYGAGRIASLQGWAGERYGIRAGYAEGDLEFFGNQFAGLPNAGEFEVSGTHFSLAAPELVGRRELGAVNMGISANDAGVGAAFILHSAESLFTRFAAAPPVAGNSEHLIVALWKDGAWHYDANGMVRPFEPRPSDVILAELDYGTGRVTPLAGAMSIRHGITAGYLRGDLEFFENYWGGAANAGEFKVTGSYFDTLAGPRLQVVGEDLAGLALVRPGESGRGYLMHTALSLSQRFGQPMQAGSNDHIAAVFYRDGQWQFDDGVQLTPFQPDAGDLLIAEVDFATGHIDALTASGERQGIASGMESGNLQFVAAADGVIVSGSFFRRDFLEHGVAYEVGLLRGGIAARDNATGQGYLMHSQQALGERFGDIPGGVSEHLVAVVFRDGGWHYDNNGSLKPFTPRHDDRLLAEIDFGADEIRSLEGRVGMAHGVALGYLTGDLRFFADRFGGQANDGEFEVTGSRFVAPALTEHVELGPVRMGIAANDAAQGQGFILHSRESLYTRFAATPPASGNSDHLIIVFIADGQWWYDANGAKRTFAPRSSDTLLAEVDYTNDTVTPWEGWIGDRHGIAAGYLEGDLVFYANRWGGSFNAGEFRVTGSFFRTVQRPS